MQPTSTHLAAVAVGALLVGVLVGGFGLASLRTGAPAMAAPEARTPRDAAPPPPAPAATTDAPPPQPSPSPSSAPARSPDSAPASTPTSAKGETHSHAPVQVPDGAPHPRLSLALWRDAMDGFDLQLTHANYAMQPPPRGVDMSDLMAPRRDPTSGYVEGHAHLYVNGAKISRVYASQVHIPDKLLRDGVNQITVTLNSHGHMQWAVGKREVLATLFVNRALDAPVVHRFESFPVEPAPDRPAPP